MTVYSNATVPQNTTSTMGAISVKPAINVSHEQGVVACHTGVCQRVQTRLDIHSL